jgi:hypothetical protein
MSSSQYIITVPNNLDIDGSIELANILQSVPPNLSYIVDFSNLSFVKPFGMLYAAEAINNFLKSNKNTEGRSNYTSNAISYAQFMVFFKSAGFDMGMPPRDYTTGGSTYIPITYQKTTLLKSRSEIEHLAYELAKRLTNQNTGSLLKVLNYAFREIIRNVVEHSGALNFGYCAQYWPRTGEVEIAIIDHGLGLSKTLRNNPFLTIENDHDAIMYALSPGISGKVYEGIPITDDAWQNSGFGLYLTQRLCTEGGNFFICSGQTGFYRTRYTNKNNYYLDC